jgi:hypothetical protein
MHLLKLEFSISLAGLFDDKIQVFVAEQHGKVD